MIKCKNLITGNEVFPFAFALFSAAIETLLLHFGGGEFPQELVAFGLHESLIQLRSDHQELLRLLNTPLRESVGGGGLVGGEG